MFKPDRPSMIMLAVNAGVIHHGGGIDPSTHGLSGGLIYPRSNYLSLRNFLPKNSTATNATITPAPTKAVARIPWGDRSKYNGQCIPARTRRTQPRGQTSENLQRCRPLFPSREYAPTVRVSKLN